MNLDELDSIEPWAVDGIAYRGKLYRLREPSAGDGHKYRASRAKGTRLVDDGKTILLGETGETEILLVALCLREVGADGREREVPPQVVRGWPDRVVSALYAEVKRRSPTLDGPAAAGKSAGDGPDEGPGTAAGDDLPKG